MGKITISSVFRFLIYMLMVTTYFPLIYNNLPPVIGSHHLWAILWGLAVILYKPKIFSSHLIVIILLYGLYLGIGMLTFWNKMDNWNKTGLLTEFYQILMGASVLMYFYQEKDFKGLATLTKWVIFFLVITSISTIATSLIDPLYARKIVGVNPYTSEGQELLKLNKFGSGGYGTDVVFMSLLVLLIYYFKNPQISLYPRWIIGVCFSLFIFAIISMQITTNVIISVVFSIIALIGTKRLSTTIILISLFSIISISIPQKTYINIISRASGLFDSETILNERINDIALYLETESNLQSSDTQTEGRVERYPILWKSFSTSPLFGCFFFSDGIKAEYDPEGGHLFWMNKLTVTGLFGFLFFLSIISTHILANLRRLKTSYNVFYIIATFSIVCYGLVKSLGGRETWYAIFILIPGIFYLPQIKSGISQQKPQVAN